MRRWSPPHEASPGRERRPGTSRSVRNRAPPWARSGQWHGGGRPKTPSRRRGRRTDEPDRRSESASGRQQRAGEPGRCRSLRGPAAGGAADSRRRSGRRLPEPGPRALREALPSAACSRRRRPMARPAGPVAWEQVGLPRLAARAGADVLHLPALHDAAAAGPACRRRRCTTRPSSPIPTCISHEARASSGRGLAPACAWRDRCVVPSRATLDELARVTGAVRGQVDVAHHGVDPAQFHPAGEDEREAAQAHLSLRSSRYVAFLGTIEPRKSVPALVRGWVRAVSDMADPPALVIAGGRGWDTGVEAALASVPGHLEVLLPGYLPLELLAGFLGGAEVVAYPSTAARGSDCRCSRPWRVAQPCSPRLPCPARGRRGRRRVHRARPPRASGPRCVELLDRPDRRAELSAAALARAGLFTWAASAEQHLADLRARGRAG